MAIFTKDGKMYVVEGPNPLVKQQVPWDPSKLVFHNFEWEDIKSNPKRPAESKRKPEFATAQPAPAVADPPQEAVEPEVSIPKPSPEPPPIENESKEEGSSSDDKQFDLPYIKYKVLCHCLPARVEQRKDSLYGESWGRVKYGAKFVFPCIVISSSDLVFEFWTSDPRGQILEKSVVYPFSYEVHNQSTDSYDRIPYDDYRWWRISSKESKEGGWLFRASPSDFQPDFSD